MPEKRREEAWVGKHAKLEAGNLERGFVCRESDDVLHCLAIHNPRGTLHVRKLLGHLRKIIANTRGCTFAHTFCTCRLRWSIFVNYNAGRNGDVVDTGFPIRSDLYIFKTLAFEFNFRTLAFNFRTTAREKAMFYPTSVLGSISFESDIE